MPFLICLSLLGFCFAFTRLSRYSIEYAPLFIISSIITALYFFAYIHFLKIGSNTIIIIGGLLFILSPSYMRRDNITPGFIIFIVIAALFLFQAHDGFLRKWDEFTHWGPHIKLMLLNNGFLNAADVTGHKSYPPAGALFEYLFLHTTGFNEGTAYIAQCLITIAPLSIFLCHYRWCEWKQALIAFAFALLVLILLHIQIGASTTLYMDGMCGLYFGAMMIVYFSLPQDQFKFIYLLPVVISLTLFKQKLLPLVLMATAVIFIYEIILYFQKKNNKSHWRFLALLLFPIASILTTKSWHAYLAAIGTKVEWKMNLTITKLHDAFFAPAGAVPHTIIMNYLHASISLSWFVGVVILLTIFSYCLYPDSNKKVALVSIQSVLLLGFLAYLFGLLLMYLFSFSTFEGITHASMQRYLRIYYLGWALVTIYFVLDAARDSIYCLPKKTGNGLVVLVIILFSGVMIFHKKHDHILQLRQSTNKIANAVKKVTPNNTSVFIVWQKSNGFPDAQLMYELTPRKPNIGCSCIGKPYDQHDVWTCQITAQQLKTKLRQYHYLLLAYVDQNFWTHFGSLIPDHTHLIPLTTYSVCENKNYDSFGNAGCEFHTHHAYLFKIIEKNGKMQLINVKAQS